MGFPAPDLSPLGYIIGAAVGGFAGIVVSCVTEALGFLFFPALAGWALPIIIVGALLGLFIGKKVVK